MVQMIPLHREAFKPFSDWIDEELPSVPDKADVWSAFLNHSSFGSDALARTALANNSPPFLFVERIPGFKGLFDPAKPKKISISRSLAEQLASSPGSQQARNTVEATVLHELVHWSWANAGKTEPPGREKGDEFETEAYGDNVDVEPPRRSLAAAPGSELGLLSRQFESNGKPGAIGHDRHGGWSYGLYQLASRMGSVADFLAFLRRQAPTHRQYAGFHELLQSAGGDVGARNGTMVFQTAWQDLANDPVFSQAQHHFIKTTHYDRYIANLRAADIDLSNRSPVLHDVAWSVSVQHGPGKTVIFTRPWNALDANARADDATLIDAVYLERSRVDVYFRNSTPEVRESVRRRFRQERAEALRMLQSRAA